MCDVDRMRRDPYCFLAGMAFDKLPEEVTPEERYKIKCAVWDGITGRVSLSPMAPIGERGPVMVVELEGGVPVRAYGDHRTTLYLMDILPKENALDTREIDLGMEHGPFWGTLRRLDVNTMDPARTIRVHDLWLRSA